MKIVIEDRGSDRFYEEVVNVAAQSRFILKKHSYKVKDYFKSFRNLLIACLVLMVLLIAMMAAWGVRPLDITAMICLVFAVLFCFVYLSNMKKLRKAMAEDVGTVVITLDENGIEYDKANSQMVKMTWESVAVVRNGAESLCILPANPSGMLICVENRYAGKIIDWLSQNRPDVELI